MSVSRRLDLVRHGLHTQNMIQPLKGGEFTLRTYQVKKKSVTRDRFYTTLHEMVVVVKTIRTKSKMLPARGGRKEGMLSVLWAHS